MHGNWMRRVPIILQLQRGAWSEELEDLLLTRGCAEISDDSTPQRTLGYDTKLTLDS